MTAIINFMVSLFLLGLLITLATGVFTLFVWAVSMVIWAVTSLVGSVWKAITNKNN